MDNGMYIELFGYLGSVLVVVSMLMSSVVKLRIINMIGSLISGTYALIIGSFPLALMNICLIIINVINLIKLLRVDRKYELVEGCTKDAYYAYFLQHYGQDIKAYFPEFSKEKNMGNKVYYVFCNEAPAGLFLGNMDENRNTKIELDYTTPAYRDCSVAKFLYIKLKECGMKELHISQPSDKHRPFLEKMGYSCNGKEYVKTF